MFRNSALAALTVVAGGWLCDSANAQNSPESSANLKNDGLTTKSGDAQSQLKTKTAVSSMSPTSTRMASMSPGTYVLETTPMLSSDCASCGAYGYSVMGSQMMASPCGAGMGYATPMTYVWTAPVYTTTYVVTPVLINQSFDAFGYGYGEFGGGAFGGGAYGGGGSMGGGMHMRHPYQSYRRPWYTPGPAMQHRTIGSY